MSAVDEPVVRAVELGRRRIHLVRQRLSSDPADTVRSREPGIAAARHGVEWMLGLRAVLAGRLGSQAVGLADVACTLAVHPRTLQRTPGR